jgi:hypothetical protein
MTKEAVERAAMLTNVRDVREQEVMEALVEHLREQDSKSYEWVRARLLGGGGRSVPNTDRRPEDFSLILAEAIKVLFERAEMKPKRRGRPRKSKASK